MRRCYGRRRVLRGLGLDVLFRLGVIPLALFLGWPFIAFGAGTAGWVTACAWWATLAGALLGAVFASSRR